MIRAQRLWFAALLAAACQESATPSQDASLDAVVEDAPPEAGTNDALGSSPCTEASALPCPPQTYATWPMPNPPGEPLPHAAVYTVNGDVAVDRVTGLHWQRSFSEKITWHEATLYCETLELAGATDWRLPSRIELISLVDYTRLPSINQETFPNTADDYFWSSSVLANDNQLAFSVYFGAGLTAYGAATGASGHARCVRGGSAGASPRFRLTNEEVFDNNTQLSWQRKIVAPKLSWSIAVDYCKQQGWRLPSTKELQTIVDETHSNPTADLQLFPATPAAWFWTSTRVNKAGLANAVYVDLRDGATEEASNIEEHWVRCVR